MPFYEFRCTKCDAREETFLKRIPDIIEVPNCPKAGNEVGHEMVQMMSLFQRHLTSQDKIEEAEAKWGKEVDAAMGPEPDVGKYARRYAELAENLPPPDKI
jgi:putative FmdB family regulatory protein